MHHLFAVVILAQLAAMESNPTGETRLVSKLKLAQMLLKKKVDKANILKLYKFLDGILVMSNVFDVQYNNEVKRLEKEEFKVSSLSNAERFGLEQGKILGAGSILQNLLEYKFENLPENYRSKIQTADEATIILWSHRLLNATTLEEVFDN